MLEIFVVGIVADKIVKSQFLCSETKQDDLRETADSPG